MQGLPVMYIVLLVLLGVAVKTGQAYDPKDEALKDILPAEDTFEPFYPREENGMKNGAVRAPHAHGSFFSHRHPGLVDVRNPGAYGFRFDGKRRFNFD